MSYKSRKGLWLEVVLSCTQREHILKACHSGPTAGHLGRTKTFYKISERYYWPGLYKDVKEFVSNCYVVFLHVCQRSFAQKYNIEKCFLYSVYQVKLCDLCQRTNTRKFDKIRPELHPVKVQSPWHHLGIDLIGPLPVTERNNKYILTVSDYCTKWVAAFPLASKVATGVATSLLQVKFVSWQARNGGGKGMIIHVIPSIFYVTHSYS